MKPRKTRSKTVFIRSDKNKRPAAGANLIGHEVRRVRRNLGLTLRELALAAGCGPIFIHQLETGKRTVRLDKMLDVFSVLGLQVFVRREKPVVAIGENP